LPSGDVFDLHDDKPGCYLYHNSALGNFSLGSDSITHSYKNQIKKKWLTQQIPQEVQVLFDLGSTIGAFIIFPNNQVDRKHTINQIRGILRLIDDRFDLTLECIKRFYTGKPSPLGNALERYVSFFQLFETFTGYVDFFLLNDLVDESGDVKFYLPFDDFISPPRFWNVDDYLIYKDKVETFITSRNRRIEDFANKTKI
jgi:hypothetical protein